MQDDNKKKFLITSIELVIGFLHVIGIGRNSTKENFILSASYFSDLALPFGFYFLLTLIESKVPQLRKWWLKAGFIFLIASLAELGQYFGLYILGRTFDPVDIAAYALGVILAVGVEFLLSKTFNFWNINRITSI